MRVWGRIEGRPQNDDDPLEVPTMVYGFVEVPEGSKVDLTYHGGEVTATFVSETESGATFSLGRKEPPLTLTKAEFTLCVRRENDGVICPDRQQRSLREAWDRSAELGDIWK